jgi:hypothetical protein
MIVRFRSLSSSGWGYVALGAASVAVYAVIAFAYAARGHANNDEGFYAYASREVMRGRIPYRDFGYTQTPVLPYVEGVLLNATGYGIRHQRNLNVVWGAVSLLLAMAVWKRARLQPLAAAALAAAWILCQALVYFDTIGKTYALSQLFLLAAAGALYLGASPGTKVLLLSLACVLAVGCRLTVAPAAGILWLGLAMTERGRIPLFGLVAVPLLLALLILGPFAAADPVNAAYWCLGCHLHVLLPRIRMTVSLQSIRSAPGFLVAAFAGVVALLSRPGKASDPAPWILAAGIVGWAVGVGVPGTYADYSTPFMALVIVGCGCALGGGTLRIAGAASVLILVASIFGLVVETQPFLSGHFPEAVTRAAAYVRANTLPGDAVLTPMPEIALEAGRDVVPGLEMGKFGLTAEMDPKTAAARHLLTWDRLLLIVANQRAPIIVLSRFRDSNFAWSFPSLNSFTDEAYQTFAKVLLARYDCTYADADFLIFEKKGKRKATFSLKPSDL